MRQAGFNPQARWDRRIPLKQDDVHPGELNQNIEVLAWFRKARVYPRLFIWNNHKYKIKTITYYWQQRRGEAIHSYFSVNTGSDLYQISFNHTTSAWKIDKIIE